MGREKLGNVYGVKLPNGYKIIQLAYIIPKEGKYIRVFDGLYDRIPDNLEQIICGEHNYVISIGSLAFLRKHKHMIEKLAYYPVPACYPFPKYGMKFWMNQSGEIFRIWITPTDKTVTGSLKTLSFAASSIQELPVAYQDVKLISGYVTPDWLLYLLDYDFKLDSLTRFWPQTVLGDKWKDVFNLYSELLTPRNNANV